MDRIWTEHIEGTAQVRHFGDKVREAGLRWFGHVLRRASDCISRRMLKMEEDDSLWRLLEKAKQR